MDEIYEKNIKIKELEERIESYKTYNKYLQQLIDKVENNHPKNDYACRIYFDEYDKLPHLNIDSLAFADDETVKIAETQYAQTMKAYLKDYNDFTKDATVDKSNNTTFIEKSKPNKILLFLLILFIVSTIFFWQKHVSDKQKLQDLKYYDENIVFTTPTGEKYHKFNCQHVNEETSRVYKLSKAVSDGYEPCKNCNPPKD